METKLVLVYKTVDRPFDTAKTDKNRGDKYYAANVGDTGSIENRLKELGVEYLILEKDISDEDSVKACQLQRVLFDLVSYEIPYS